MAYDGWMTFGGTELINNARLSALSKTLGIDAVILPEPHTLYAGPGGYSPALASITNAPWYRATDPASAEFAGFLPLSIRGLEDSTYSSEVREYITDGGRTTGGRNATVSVVFNGLIVASTERGAEFGRRWLSRILRGTNPDVRTETGEELRYRRHDATTLGVGAFGLGVYRREVTMSRGLSITRKRQDPCYALWTTTFTLTAGDPYEYAEVPPLSTIRWSASSPSAPTIITDNGRVEAVAGGSLINIVACAKPDFTPLRDPQNNPFVAPPVPPDFYPPNWPLLPGRAIRRISARTRFSTQYPSFGAVVPQFHIATTHAVRGLQVAVWPASVWPTGAYSLNHQCDPAPLFSAVVTHVPAYQEIAVDGVRRAVYRTNNPALGHDLRRADSLAYGSADASPVEWKSFEDEAGLVVTVDHVSPAPLPSDFSITARLTFVPRSD